MVGEGRGEGAMGAPARTTLAFRAHIESTTARYQLLTLKSVPSYSSMPKGSISRGGAKRGRGSSHASRGRRQNKRMEGMLDERRPDSAVDDVPADDTDGSAQDDGRSYTTHMLARSIPYTARRFRGSN